MRTDTNTDTNHKSKEKHILVVRDISQQNTFLPKEIKTRYIQNTLTYLPPPLDVKLMMGRNKSGGQACQSKRWGKGLS
jgi:hypothetical protein